jgi:hypothetical protein
MIDWIIILLACLMISITIAFVYVDYPDQYNIILGIIGLTGSLAAIYEFVRNKNW